MTQQLRMNIENYLGNTEGIFWDQIRCKNPALSTDDTTNDLMNLITGLETLPQIAEIILVYFDMEGKNERDMAQVKHLALNVKALKLQEINQGKKSSPVQLAKGFFSTLLTYSPMSRSPEPEKNKGHCKKE